jgi:ankyrin repeat protein
VDATIPPLAAAALIGRLDAVAILLAAGVRPVAPSLFLAANGATTGAASVIEALTASGADVDERSVFGMTPLFAATAAAARAENAARDGTSRP